MSSGKQPSSSHSRSRPSNLGNNVPTHEVNLVCNDGACSVWAAYQLLGVINGNDKTNQ